MTVVVVGFAVASIASLAAIGSIRNAGRDNSDKSALGVAEAGVEQAIYRQNKILTTPYTSSTRCLVMSASQTLIASYAGADGWCDEQTGAVNGGTYRYRVRPDLINSATGQREIKIVSEGTLNGETRRIEVNAAAATGTPAFGGGQFVGLNRLVIQGNSSVNAAMRTNSDLTIVGNPSCNGDVTVGAGKRVIPSPSACTGSVTQATTTLGPVDMGNVRTVNSNARLSNGQDVVQGNQASWNPTTKTLSLGNTQSSVTLGGQNYLFCKLSMNGGNLIVAQGATVRIYFDSPENCPGVSQPQIDIGGNAKVTVTSADPSDLAFLVAGSDTATTEVRLRGTARVTNYITVYAPKSIVSLLGNSTYYGAIAGKELSADGNVTVSGVESTLTFQAAVELTYKRTRFVECTGPLPTVGSPETGC